MSFKIDKFKKEDKKVLKYNFDYEFGGWLNRKFYFVLPRDFLHPFLNRYF